MEMAKKLAVASALGAIALTATATAASAQPYIGEMRLFGSNWCPKGWAPADGRTIPISSNTALFSLIGTLYGGDARTTFQLPDLRGRVPVGHGQGPGLSPRKIGTTGGSEANVLTSQNMPAHTHGAEVELPVGVAGDPDAAAAGLEGGTINGIAIANASAALTNFEARVAPEGGSQPVSAMPPYVVMNWCIAVEGVFPPRG